MIIKNIFDGNFDEEVHSDFMKFSRGEFKEKYVVEAKKQKDKWSIKTSPEFANYLVRKCLEDFSGEKVSVKGVIVSTLDLEDELGFDIKKKSNFQGVKKIEIDVEVSPEGILELMEKYPRVFFGLSFKTESSELKIKPKAPKSGKPSTKGEDKPKVDFCSFKTSDKKILDELFFDFDYNSVKNLRISHSIVVEDIVYPENVKEMSPAEVREKAKRKGKVVRFLDLDGEEKKSEANFIA